MSNSRKTLTRQDLYDAVYQKAKLSRSETASLVELVLKEITDVVVRGETVKLASFGNFVVHEKGERMGRNPKTGVPASIPSRRVVSFKASAIMKQRINVDHQLDRSEKVMRKIDMESATQAWVLEGKKSAGILAFAHEGAKGGTHASFRGCTDTNKMSLLIQ
jgi:integration host factor subunit alpha